jgi:uncharacterized glyoxalase superfamily protein PhnB
VERQRQESASVDGHYTQNLRIELDGDIEAHFQRAKAAGARVLMEPKDQFYGARTYSVLDLEGHPWAFSKTVRYVSREEAEKASGLKIEGWIEP